MRWLLLFAFCSRVFAASFEDAVPSSPDEIASLSTNLLIEGLISPLSGQVSLCETDLHVKGAQDLYLKRTYIPPQIYGRYENKDESDRLQLGMALAGQESRRWTILPHLWAGFNYHSQFFQVRDPSGFVLEFEIQGNQGILKTSSCGLSNLNQGQPDGSADLRNIEFSVETEGMRITWPDGLERYYQKQSPNKYRLEKELLPNGKAIRYEYGQQELVRIVSSDPNGKYTYGVIEKLGDTHYVGTDGSEARFDYEMVEVKGKVKNGKLKQRFGYSTAVLIKASNPIYSNSIQYNDRTLLSSYDRKAYPVSFDYSKQKGSVARVERFSTPSGSISLSYDSPIAGQKGGSTTAMYPDGAQVVYRFDKNLLLTAIENWLNDLLVNQKIFAYDEKQHLASVETRDGDNGLLVAKRYTCDTAGNPLIERIEGDFGTFTIHRSFAKNRLIKEERDDGLGNEYTYLGNTRLPTLKTMLKNGQPIRKTTYTYDEANNLIEESEEGRKVTRYTLYVNAPHLHRVEWKEERDWENRLIMKVRFLYDAYGNCTEEQHYGSDEKLGFAIQRTYAPNGDLLEETNPIGQKAFYKYNARGNCIQEIPFSNRLAIDREFDQKGRLTLLKTGGHASHFAYNALDKLTEKTDYLGLKTSFAYDPVHGQPTAIEAPPTIVNRVYDAFGREVEKSNAYGAKTRTRYNSYGDPLEILHPDGGVETFAYASDGSLIRSTDQEGITTRYVRDCLGRVLSKTVGAYTASYTYDAYQLIEKIDAKGFSTRYRYDSVGRKIEENREGRVTRFGYDPLGFLAWEEQGARKISYQRDVLGRLLEKSIDGSVKTSWTYDAFGNIASIYRGAATYFTYDDYNRLIEKIDSEGAKTTISYEEGSQVLTKRMLDPRAIETTEIYNAHGCLLKKEIAGQRLEEFAYDDALRAIAQDHLAFTYTPEGHRASMTEAGMRTTNWTYTAGGKVLAKQKPDGTILRHEYDAQGRLVKIGTREFRYDELNRLVGGSGFARTLDPFGNILREEWSNGLWIESAYDDWDRPLQRTLPDQSQIRYFYEGPFLKEVVRIDANGKISYTHRYDRYDEAGRLLAETHLGSSTYVFDAMGRQILKDDPYLTESCSYDPIGNLIQKNEVLYSYDPLSQITSESGRFTARYDARFNRIEKNGFPISIDALNQIETEEYDANGNLIRPGFVYDAFNQLIEAGGEQFVYDALGRRIQRGFQSFLYAGEDEIGVFEQGKAAELQIPGYKKAVGIEIQGRSYFPIHDVQGTIRCLIDWKTGEIFQRNQCDVFGVGLNPKIPYAYVGKWYDAQTGLFYFGKRYYDPHLGRWLTTDLLGPIDHANLYQYVYNNPFQYGDPSGMFVVPLIGIAFGAGLSITPVGWAILGAAAVSYTTVWSVQKMTENGIIKPDYASSVTSLVGGITGSMVNRIPQTSWNSSTGSAYEVSPYISEFGYIPERPWVLSRTHEGSVDPSLPANPNDLLNRPGWQETTHPDAGKKGHRTFENEQTGEKLRYDEGKPGCPGHKAHDHYHRPNPNKTNWKDEYLDGQRNPVSDGHDQSHIYSPDKIWWD